MQLAALGIVLMALLGSDAVTLTSESCPDSLEGSELKMAPVGSLAEQVHPSTITEIIDMPENARDQHPQCPDAPPYRIQKISDYEIPGAKPYVQEEGWTIGNGTSEGGDKYNWKHSFFFSDFCFVGQVIKSEYHCLTVPPSSTRNIAFIEFKVIDSYWGPMGGKYVVDANVIQLAGCVTYQVKDKRYRFFRKFDPGDKYLVLGKFDNGRQRVLLEGGLFLLDGSEFVHADGSRYPRLEIESYAKQMSRLRSLHYQSIRSDLICEAIVESPDSLNDQGRSKLKPVHVITGNNVPATIEYEKVDDLDSSRDYRLSPRLKFGNTYLLFLVDHEGDTYRSLRGWHSTFLVIEDCLFTRRKDYFGRCQEVLDEIRGYLNDP